MVVGMVFVSPIWVKVSILAQDAEYCKLYNMNPSEYTHTHDTVAVDGRNPIRTWDAGKNPQRVSLPT